MVQVVQEQPEDWEEMIDSEDEYSFDAGEVTDVLEGIEEEEDLGEPPIPPSSLPPVTEYQPFLHALRQIFTLVSFILTSLLWVQHPPHCNSS